MDGSGVARLDQGQGSARPCSCEKRQRRDRRARALRCPASCCLEIAVTRFAIVSGGNGVRAISSTRFVNWSSRGTMSDRVAIRAAFSARSAAMSLATPPAASFPVSNSEPCPPPRRKIPPRRIWRRRRQDGRALREMLKRLLECRAPALAAGSSRRRSACRCSHGRRPSAPDGLGPRFPSTAAIISSTPRRRPDDHGRFEVSIVAFSPGRNSARRRPDHRRQELRVACGVDGCLLVAVPPRPLSAHRAPCQVAFLGKQQPIHSHAFVDGMIGQVEHRLVARRCAWLWRESRRQDSAFSGFAPGINWRRVRRRLAPAAMIRSLRYPGVRRAGESPHRRRFRRSLRPPTRSENRTARR